MTAKEYLEQIELADKKINNRLAEISKLRMLATSVSACNSGERVQTSKRGDTITNIVAKIVDYEESLNDMIDNYIDLKRQIITQIELLSSLPMHQVLYKRYVEFKTFSLIAIEMDYDERQIYRVHKRALQVFEEKFLKND